MSALMRLVLLAFAIAAAVLPAQAAVKIQRVVSPGGLEVWLMEDHRVPVMALNFMFNGGTALDPAGKEGLATFTALLLDEGAGDLNATAFQKELADKSISLSFNADLDGFSGRMKTLTQYRARAFDMLSMALTKPRFDADAVERDRNEMLTEIASNLGNPNWVSRRTLIETVFAGHPYARPPDGTVETVRAIKVADMRQLLKDRLGRDQLLITAAGDITPAELGAAVDRAFGALPAKASSFNIPPASVKAAGQTVSVPRDIPQTMIAVAKAGILRNDPDWYTAQILNYTLGGGGFSSRLMEQVRGTGAKRGLSYGVYSGFVPYKHGGLIQAGGSTQNATAGDTLLVLKTEFGKMYRAGITEAELTDAKTYLTGSFVLSETSTDKIASILMSLRFYDLGIDYLEKRDALFNNVTLADAKRVAARLLNPADLTTIMVGKPQGLEKAGVTSTMPPPVPAAAAKPQPAAPPKASRQ